MRLRFYKKRSVGFAVVASSFLTCMVLSLQIAAWRKGGEDGEVNEVNEAEEEEEVVVVWWWWWWR